MSSLQRINPILTQAGVVTVQNSSVQKWIDRISFLFIGIIILCFYKIVSHKEYNDSHPNDKEQKSVLRWIVLLFLSAILYYYSFIAIELIGYFVGFFKGSNTVTVGTGNGGMITI